MALRKHWESERILPKVSETKHFLPKYLSISQTLDKFVINLVNMNLLNLLNLLQVLDRVFFQSYALLWKNISLWSDTPFNSVKISVKLIMYAFLTLITKATDSLWWIFEALLTPPCDSTHTHKQVLRQSFDISVSHPLFIGFLPKILLHTSQLPSLTLLPIWSLLN